MAQDKRVLGRVICVQHLRVRRISARLSGFVKCMRGPWEYENPPCASVGGDFWFPEKANGQMNTVEMVMAKSICHTYPHKAECAEWGIYNEVHGVWGGLTQQDRIPIQRKLNIIIRGVNVA